MTQTTLNVRIEEDVKKDFEAFCHQVGMNVSVAVNLFVKTVVREQRLPFEVALPSPKFNETTLASLAESEEIIRSGRHRFKDASEMLQALDSDADT